MSDRGDAPAINPRIEPIPLSQDSRVYVHEIPASGAQEKYLKEIPIAPQGAPEASVESRKFAA
jgi:hypothetical protein